MTQTYRYTYLRDEDRFPIACVAMHFDKETKQILVGVSTVHPKDKNKAYSKQLAREVARGRAEIAPYIIENVEGTNGVITTHDILRVVIGAIQSNQISLPPPQPTKENPNPQPRPLPIRVRKSARAWLTKTRVVEIARQANSVREQGATTHTSYFNANNPLIHKDPLQSYSTDLVPSFLEPQPSFRVFGQ